MRSAIALKSEIAATVDWTAVAAIATAVAAIFTAGAALATAFLARATKTLAHAAQDEIEAVGRGADATEAEAKVSAHALQASIRPWITSADRREVLNASIQPAEDNVVSGYIVVQNVGNGLAVLPKEGAWVWGRDGSGRPFAKAAYCFPLSPILAPGQRTTLEFTVSSAEYEDFVGRDFGWYFQIHALYTDADGGQPVVASFNVSAFPNSGANVYEIEYRKRASAPTLQEQEGLAAETPFAVVRVGKPQ